MLALVICHVVLLDQLAAMPADIFREELSDLGNVRLFGTAAAEVSPPLPTYDQACDACYFNWRFQSTIESRQAFYRHRYWQLAEVLRETRQLYQVWDAVRDVQNPHASRECRRDARKKLRQLLGDNAYYAGWLPPCVPMWYFTLID